MEVIITDTVGFIRHLPDELLKAFASTLEELQEADLLLHVIDVANPLWPQQVEVVEQVLSELELDSMPCLKVFNKIDQLPAEEQLRFLVSDEGVGISAQDAASLAPLLVRAQRMLKESAGKTLDSQWRGEMGGRRGECLVLQEKAQGLVNVA